MKIYVTGLGVVSGIGIGVSENIEALRQRKHGIGKVTLFPDCSRCARIRSET